MTGENMFFKKKEKTEAEIYEEIFAEEKKSENRNSARGSGYIVIPIVLMFVLGILVWIHAPNAALHYLYALVVMLLVCAFVGTYVYNRDGDMKLFAAIASLASIGVALQMAIDELYITYTVFQPLKLAAGLAAGVVFIVLYDLLRRFINHRYFAYVMLGFSLLIYVILYFFGIDPNGMGTHAWIQAGPITIQLTDASKIAAIMFYASLFASDDTRSEKDVLILATVFFFINLAGSVLIHELGSFFILYFLHLSIIFIFMKKGKMKRYYLLSIAALTLLGLGSAYGLYKVLQPLAAAGQLNSFTSLLWPIVRKVYLRFSVTANIYSDPYGAGYQLLQGKKALWLSGFFGNRVNFNAIPVVESDMAFIALINSFGMPAGFAAVLLFAMIMVSGSRLSIRLLSGSRKDAVVAYGLTILLCAQAALVILGSCNIIPLAGLPIPFLSRGGTYQAIVLGFCGLLLHMSEQGGVRYEGGGYHEE